ncbi:gag-pol polyprotein [Cucumis melo var. makuwa]|uniref:Gag-pol polyprotein n=1 Tax=Cucumis melo var. makuwa TaxID=1194695 RepID=A0A5D3CWQ1_CUCMM|nr:gag-pol polyprotein [Cucumis melo var. makuwa]
MRDYAKMVVNVCYTSTLELTTVTVALTDEHWILAMQEELLQFERNQGYSQIEGLDFGETFALVSRLKAIRLLMSYACFRRFKLFQMDVKSAFLNGYLSAEVYVVQPKGFVDSVHHDHVYKLRKALYGLKQALRAWYERLSTYLLQQGYRRGSADQTMFIYRQGTEFLIVQIYVDDIIFGGTSSAYVKQFVEQMKEEFEMSMVGELSFFLGFQIKQEETGIFFSQEKYANNLISKFGMDKAKPKRTPAASRPDIAFAVGMYARYQTDPQTSHLHSAKRIQKYISGGCSDDWKSTSEGCFFLGNNVAAWFSKKQNSVSLSTAEAEYIAVGSSCLQLLWMKQMLEEYGITQSSMISLRSTYLNDSLLIMVATRFKNYPSGNSSFSNNSSTLSVSVSMAPSPPKSITSLKGKRFKEILTKHPYKKVRRAISTGDEGEHNTVSSPVRSSRAARSVNPSSPVMVKKEVPDLLYYSSSKEGSNQTHFPAKPKPREVSSPKEVLPRTSDHSKYFVAPSFQASPQTSLPSVAEDDDDTDDEDYVPRTEEKTVPEATSTSIEDHSTFHAKHPSDHRSTEEPVISTKAGRQKIPPNVPFVPIDGVSFHSEEDAHKWNYVVKRRIADEANIVDQYNSYPAILDLIRNVRLIRTVSKVGPFYPRLMRELIVNLPSDFNDPSADEYQKVHIRGVYFNMSPELLNTYLGLSLPADYAVSYPTPERLAEELTGGTIPVWPVDGQLQVAYLTIKYSILHRIRISNWIPSTHAFTISTSLGHFVYLVGTGVKVNASEFIFNHLLRHVDTFAIHIPICFPRILSEFLLAQQSTNLTSLDTIGTGPRVIPLKMHLFQGSYIPDIVVEFDNAPGGTSIAATTHPTVSHPLTLSVSLVNLLLQALIAESCSLTRQISDLTDRRTILDAVLHGLRRAAFESTPPPSD